MSRDYSQSALESSVEAVTALAWCDNHDGEQHLIRVLSSPGESTDCDII